MRILHAVVLASGLAVATAPFPVMAQQDQQQAPMMGPGGQGGMMGQGGQGGMMGPGPGGMMGQGRGGMMGQRQGGMMDQDGEPDGCPMMGDMMGAGKHGMGRGMRHGVMHSVPMMEARLAYVKADLEITDAQTTAWDAYASAVRARHAAKESMHADMMKAKESGSALERIDARIKAMETMVDSLKTLKPATEALYAVLTDEQKKKADQLLGGRCGRM